MVRTPSLSAIKSPFRNLNWLQLLAASCMFSPCASVALTNFNARSGRLVGMSASIQVPSQEIVTNWPRNREKVTRLFAGTNRECRPVERPSEPFAHLADKDRQRPRGRRPVGEHFMGRLPKPRPLIFHKSRFALPDGTSNVFLPALCGRIPASYFWASIIESCQGLSMTLYFGEAEVLFGP